MTQSRYCWATIGSFANELHDVGDARRIPLEQHDEILASETYCRPCRPARATNSWK